MIIYNVTIKVSAEVADEWLDWMVNIHIPEVIGSGCFVKHQFVRLLDTDETDGVTYAVQYYAESITAYQHYLSNFAHVLRQKSIDRWKDKCIVFRSLMEVVN